MAIKAGFRDNDTMVTPDVGKLSPARVEGPKGVTQATKGEGEIPKGSEARGDLVCVVDQVDELRHDLLRG